MKYCRSILCGCFYGVFFSGGSVLAHNQPKIIGLMPVRNEENYVAQTLRALSLYTDAIVVLDDASDDSTVKIIEQLAQECRIQKIIKKEKWYRSRLCASRLNVPFVIEGRFENFWNQNGEHQDVYSMGKLIETAT